MLAAGLAYRDYATTEEIQAEREAATGRETGVPLQSPLDGRNAGRCRRFAAEGRQAVVRLKMPREGKLVINDLVRGQVEFEWAREQDHVIQRADGTCLYHLASVVDDHDFEITHVIRAEEHLSNTPRQIFIAQSLGYALPEYAHLPYVAEPGSKNKLSKRKLDKYLKNRDFAQIYEHGQAIAAAMGLTTTADTFNPVIVDFYEQVGYLPEAIIELPGAARLVAGRQDRVLDARADDRQLFARARDQGAGQLRSRKSCGPSRTITCAVAAEAKGGPHACLSAARRAGGHRRHRARSAPNWPRSSRRPATG